MKNQKKIYVELVGGLGNQLFQAVAALSLAQKLSYEPIAIVNRVSKSHSHRNTIFDEMSWSSLRKTELCSAAMLLVIIGLRLASWRKTNSFSFLGISFYSPRETGYSLSEVKGNIVFLRGYFQSYRYLSEIEKEMLPSLTNPSEIFVALESELKLEKPIVLHIRKGDFDLAKNPHGLVPPDYYKASLSVIEEIGCDVISSWVFTDDPRGISDYLKDLPVSKLPSQAHGLTTTEELFLISKANCLVIGNSTFGIWGALLAEAQSQMEILVIRPTNPFQRMSVPKDLYPKHWVCV